MDVLLVYDFELPSLRDAVRLAEIVSSCRFEAAGNPILAFVMDKAPVAVIDTILLRGAELIDLLDRALTAVDPTDGLLLKRGRDWTPADDVLALAWNLRHQMVAHRISMDGVWRNAREQMLERYQNIWRFLPVLLDRLATHVAGARAKGAVVGATPSTAARYNYGDFTRGQLVELIAKARRATSGRENEGRSDA